MSTPLSSRDWLGKSSAGLLLGFTLALGCAGLFRLAVDVGDALSMKGQFVMWMMAPVWGLTLAFCFLFRSGLRAWLWLGGANLAVWAVLIVTGVVTP